MPHEGFGGGGGGVGGLPTMMSGMGVPQELRLENIAPAMLNTIQVALAADNLGRMVQASAMPAPPPMMDPAMMGPMGPPMMDPAMMGMPPEVPGEEEIPLGPEEQALRDLIAEQARGGPPMPGGGEMPLGGGELPIGPLPAMPGSPYEAPLA